MARARGGKTNRRTSRRGSVGSEIVWGDEDFNLSFFAPEAEKKEDPLGSSDTTLRTLECTLDRTSDNLDIGEAVHLPPADGVRRPVPTPARRARGVARRMGLRRSVNRTALSGSLRKSASRGIGDPSEEAEGVRRRGISGVLGRLTPSIRPERCPVDAAEDKDGKPASAKTSSETHLRRGSKRKDKGQFPQALALFNAALIEQREELGMDHVDCGHTLNEIGACLTALGEKDAALAALEEALYIRQKHLGHGAAEVAETANNIWMVMHKDDEEGAPSEEDGRAESIEDFWARITSEA